MISPSRSRQPLGQHFLASEKILERIATAACGDRAETVVEIGPGRGALTEHLLRRAGRVIAIEIDPAMVEALSGRFGNHPGLSVIRADALEQDLGIFQPDVICGNLPYYVATPILERIARTGARAVVLIQKEVAERLAAQPGSRSYGFLTCSIGLYGKVRLLFTVKPGAFRPPPKVDSAVISFEPHARAAELGVDAESFLKFLSLCFRHKRKTLRNNLADQMARFGPALPGLASKRAEECPLEDLAALFRELSAV